MSTRVQDSDASRPLPSTLSCTDARSPHRSDASAGSAKPGGSLAMEELLRPLIVIKPHPPKLTVKPRTLQPLMLLPHEHLRLSFLDLSSPYGSFESSPAFEANIRILDLESRMGNRPVVLIARLESNRTVYVIERQANALYTLCHLGSWVDLEQLCGLATVSCPALIRQQPALRSEPTTHVPLTTPQISHTNKKRRLAIEAIQSLVKKPVRSRSISVLSQAGEASRPSTPIQGGNVLDSGGEAVAQNTPAPDISTSGPDVESQVSLVHDQDETLATPNAEGIFENIRNHYVEALYHSMGSLAYFAKGPLSRARAAFHLDCDSTLEMNDLVDFLKSLVLTTIQIDKKYRETIPKIQSDMKTVIQDSDAEQGQGKSKLRKRKSKKTKLGKDGLYPNEDDHVRKWWSIHKPQPIDDEESTTKSTEQQDIKLQTSLLRSRETQLQMILILEILCLEPLVVRENANDSQLPGLAPEEPPNSPKEIPTKKRTKHNFPFLLDVHADRLCIWQSTALDEFNRMSESQAGHKLESQRSSKSTSDSLKDFCVDIIVPFFSSRLPEQCDSINRKLGGPVMMPPPNSKRKKVETSSKAIPKPGAAAKRPARSSSTKTLETFLSKETERNRRSMSRGPGGVIALMRSASTPTILLKREASEPLSLASIPKVYASASHERYPSSTGPVSANRRAETKEKRDAFVKAELQNAISTLRRPNREVVGKAMAEADERRAVTSLSQLRKSKKPTQHTSPRNIVKATPIGTRFHDVLAKDNSSRPASLQPLNAIAEEHAVPSSSMVPSSAPRKRNREAAFGSEPAAPQIFTQSRTDQIMATPAKQSSLSRNFLLAPHPDEGLILASSPVMSRKISQPSFVAKSRPATVEHRDSGIEIPPSPGGLNVLAETPVKLRQNNLMASMDNYVTVTPIKKSILDNGSGDIPAVVTEVIDGNNKPAKKMSIFERLGWDDYDELA